MKRVEDGLGVGFGDAEEGSGIRASGELGSVAGVLGNQYSYLKTFISKDPVSAAGASAQDVYGNALTAKTTGNNVKSGTFSITVTDAAESDLSEFRSTYGFASDGSDDNSDWWQNSVANILYLAFDLGDPNSTNIDRSQLPTATRGTDSISFSYVRPIANDSGLSVTVLTSDDALQWVSPLSLGAEFSPTSFEAVPIDETGYQRVTETYNLHPGETSRFYRPRRKFLRIPRKC